MRPERDLFANFDRMRREIDEIFGDVFERRVVRSGGFSPRVDIYYCGDPPRAVVKAELAGVEIERVSLEVRGRQLVIEGVRLPPQESENRVYQQVEIEHGPFRRVVELGADVDAERASANYDDGVLRVEIPLVVEERSLRVPIEQRPASDG